MGPEFAQGPLMGAVRWPLNLHAAAGGSSAAVGSVGVMLRAGQRNNSRILLVLFALRVVSPFIALALEELNKIFGMHAAVDSECASPPLRHAKR